MGKEGRSIVRWVAQVFVLTALVAVTAVLGSAATPALAGDDGCEGSGVSNNPYNRLDGTLVRDYQTGYKYLIQSCQKHHISQDTDLASHKFDHSPVNGLLAEVSGYTYTRPRGYSIPGRMQRSHAQERCKIYIIDEISPGTYKKRYIDGNGWSKYFKPCGYGFTVVSSAFLNGYTTGTTVTGSAAPPDGQLVQATGAAEIYLLESAKKRWITNPPNFASHNFQQPVCDVTGSQATAITTGANLRAREGTLMKGDGPAVYMIDIQDGSYRKRHITSMEAFNSYGLVWANVRTWTQSYVDGYATGPHAHPVRTLDPDRWYQRLSDSGSYTTWMTLTMDRTVPSALATKWNAPITNARDAWNDPATAPNTVYFLEVAPHAENDIRITVGNWEDDFLGGSYMRDEARHLCDESGPGVGDCDASHSRPNTWWYAFIDLNEDNHVERFGAAELPDQRQTTAAHELAHVLGLAHDGLTLGGDKDGYCGEPGRAIPETITDDDCNDDFSTKDPQPWDSCGVNHAYYDPSFGYSGC